MTHHYHREAEQQQQKNRHSLAHSHTTATTFVNGEGRKANETSTNKNRKNRKSFTFISLTARAKKHKVNFVETHLYIYCCCCGPLGPAHLAHAHKTQCRTAGAGLCTYSMFVRKAIPRSQVEIRRGRLFFGGPSACALAVASGFASPGQTRPGLSITHHCPAQNEDSLLRSKSVVYGKRGARAKLIGLAGRLAQNRNKFL